MAVGSEFQTIANHVRDVAQDVQVAVPLRAQAACQSTISTEAYVLRVDTAAKLAIQKVVFLVEQDFQFLAHRKQDTCALSAPRTAESVNLHKPARNATLGSNLANQELK